MDDSVHLCRQKGVALAKKRARPKPWRGQASVAWLALEKIKPGEIALKRISHGRLDLTNQPVHGVFTMNMRKGTALFVRPSGETKVQVT